MTYPTKTDWEVCKTETESARLSDAEGLTISTQSIAGSMYMSQKAVDYILHPKRGAFNMINPDICTTLTAKGQSNWIGTFISPDIDHVEHEVKLGGRTPTIIYMKDGSVIEYDGQEYRKRD